MKKIFIIGPIIGAIAAIVIKKKKQSAEPALEVQGASTTPPAETPANDTTPPA